MSIFSANTNTTTINAAAQEASRRWWASALARYTSRRREDLGLTVTAAAALAGLELSEWCALEDGWVPEDLATLRSIAATLRVRWTDYHGLAFLAGLQQRCR